MYRNKIWFAVKVTAREATCSRISRDAPRTACPVPGPDMIDSWFGARLALHAFRPAHGSEKPGRGKLGILMTSTHQVVWVVR